MIVTFYSFKGGVGRSMAMANVGRWLQLKGLNVVMVDWDLEAPGLETFFAANDAQLREWRRRIGLADLLSLYKHDFPALNLERESRGAVEERLQRVLPPLASVLIDVPPPTDASAIGGTADAPPGRLRLLTAGLREGADSFAAYANEVQSFDWNEFYAAYRGQEYFEWMRASLTEPNLADVVLVDSRTGVTEMGGVCTRQLADTVVVLTAPNRQNVEGAAQIAATFNREDVVHERDERRVRVVMVPSRVEVQSTDVKIAFEKYFRENATPFMPEELAALQSDFWELRIPQISQYSYRERLAIGASDGDPDLVNAYKALAAHIAWLAPLRSRFRLAMRSEFRRVFGEERVRALLDMDDEFERALSSVGGELLPSVKELLLRFVQVRARAHDADTYRTWFRDQLQDALGPAIDAAIRADLLRGEQKEGEKVLLQLSEPRLVSHSAELSKWIEADRPFLAWRQRLRGYLEDWEGVNRDPGALLQGTLLREAREQSASHASRLLADEAGFISLSLRREEELIMLASTADRSAMAQRPQSVPPPMPASHGGQLARRLGILAAVVVAVAATTFWLTRGSTASRPQLLADSLVHAGNDFSNDSNYVTAESLYTLALAADVGSVEARRSRATVRMQLRDFKGAMSDLDMALQVDSTSLALLRQRAEARANLSDFTGSLADLRRVPPDSLSTSELRERADLSYSQGDDSLALADYGRLVERGSVADGQLGRARVLEQLGRKTEAIAAYRAAIPTITNSTQRGLAEAALRKLAPRVELPVAIVPQVSLFLQSQEDATIAGIINKTLSKYGLKLTPRGRMLYTQRDSLGAAALVRYYFAEDADLAKRTLLAVSEALDVSGSYRKVDVFYESTPNLGRKPRRGEIDITLPPTFRPSKR